MLKQLKISHWAQFYSVRQVTERISPLVESWMLTFSLLMAEIIVSSSHSQRWWTSSLMRFSISDLPKPKSLSVVNMNFLCSWWVLPSPHITPSLPVRLFLALLTVLIIIGFDRELVSSFENKSFKILCEPDGVKVYVGSNVLKTGTSTSILSTHQSLSLSVCRHGGSARCFCWISWTSGRERNHAENPWSKRSNVHDPELEALLEESVDNLKAGGSGSTTKYLKLPNPG